MYLLFDIGGTKMRFAFSKDGETFDEPKIVLTPQDFKKGINLINRTAKDLAAGKEIKKAVGGIRRLDTAKEKIVPDFRLPNWSGKPLKQKLEEAVSAPVYLENDTALAGLGEAIAGAGREFKIVVYMTISTGVGGSRLVDKKIDTSSFGFEPGHQIIDADWKIYPYLKDFAEKEKMGQLEAYISGTSVEKRFDKKPYEVVDEKVWDELARLLAYGLNNTIVHWSPDVVVLGGGMMKKIGIPIDRVKFHLKKILKIYPQLPEIKKAELGDVGGLHGALSYLKQIRK